MRTQLRSGHSGEVHSVPVLPPLLPPPSFSPPGPTSHLGLRKTQIPLRDALLLHEVLEEHAQDLEDALGLYSKASSGGAVGMVSDKNWQTIEQIVI